ncbi:MAG: hypothetical protein DMG08_29880, partial [Acidobacteria bacterium]
VVQPGNASAGASIPGPATVTVQDSFGNTVTDSTAPITISIGTNPAGGILSGTTTKNALAGAASFADLSISNGGNGYTLAASSSGLTGGTTQVFNIYPVVPVPSITSVSPTSGAVGASITITGSNFGAAQGNGIVAFNGTSATPANWSATSIAVPVPTGASTGNVVVNTSGGASNGVSFTVLPTPAITSLSPASGAVGVSITITGTGFGAAQGASTVTFNGTQASPASWSDSQIVLSVPSGATTGNVVVHASGVDSNGANFTVITPPVITSVSPNSGAAGTQVTITGSNFGSTQGSSTVSFNGTTVTPASWSVTRVVGLVPTGATTGSVVVTVGGVASNGLNFTVITYPVISSVSPNSGVAGTQVMIAGSGFGATQGSGSVWLGTAPGQVVSWSDGQVMATVASGSNSGSAQILQNGVWSNSMPFTISNPRITSITPDRGFPGTVVTIQGTGFGSSQESGIAWIGGTNASASSWSETQVSAIVAASAVSGIVKIQQNGVWSNAVTFTVPSASVTLSPNVLSMVVGDTRSLQALNANYQPVAGLTWTSSDTAILTLSAGDPPVLTAVAPGNVTVFAGDASADVTVYPGALPVGTVLWSIPGNGSRVSGIYPAVPSSSGVADVFATEDDGTVLAVTADGEVAWTTNVGTDFWNFLPDFQGGLVVYNINNSTFYKLDGLTGQAYPAYQPSQGVAWASIGPPAIHIDGTIFTSDYTCTNADCSNSAGWLVGIDPSSGTSKFRAPTANSTGHVTSTSNDFDAFGNPWCSPLGSQT